MTASALPKTLTHLPNFTARKVQAIPGGLPADVPDSLAAWATRYLALAVVGVRSAAVTKKIALHLDRFITFFLASYGHDRISICLRRDVLAWQQQLVTDGLAPATINNHLASVSAFTTWVAVQAPTVFPVGDPAKGVRELGLPPLEPRALTPAQVRSLKNLCDRLERFHRLKGQRWASTTAAAPVRAHGRPWRDRGGPRESEPGRRRTVVNEMRPHRRDSVLVRAAIPAALFNGLVSNRTVCTVAVVVGGCSRQSRFASRLPIRAIVGEVGLPANDRGHAQSQIGQRTDIVGGGHIETAFPVLNGVH